MPVVRSLQNHIFCRMSPARGILSLDVSQADIRRFRDCSIQMSRTAMTTQNTRTIDRSTTEDTGYRFGRIYGAGLWVLQILAAAFLFFSALMKLTGAEEMVLLFEDIGIGQWFRYLTGSLQVIGAVLLVVPRLAVYGALLLASTMGGAVLTHLFVIGGSALVPLVLLTILLGIIWARRDQLP